MILGIGSDIVDINRIQASLDKFADRFIERIFTPFERDHCDATKNRAACYAKRFAAKEACWKALGPGSKKGIEWHDFEISNGAAGEPILTLSGKALERLTAITPDNMTGRIDLSLSDDPPYALAYVVVSAETPEQANSRKGAVWG